MKTWKTGGILVWVVLATGQPGLSAAAADIDPGTHILVRLESRVSTRTAKAGDPVQFRTAGPIISDGAPIPIGSAAQGVVTLSKRPGRVRGRGELDIRIVSIMQPDGTMLPVTTSPVSIEPPQASVHGPRAYPPPSPPLIPILAGMIAGYGTAVLVSHGSNSEETVVRAGVVAGLTTGVLVGVLKRGEDLVLRPGLTMEVVVERAARPE